MKLVWLTDTHFDHLHGKGKFDGYGADIDADAILISGDIAESNTIVPLLEHFAMQFLKPIYFVLGNHDFYMGSIFDIKAKVANAFHDTLATFLDNAEPCILDDSTAVTGHSGFYDAVFGDPYHSRVEMGDFSIIEELKSNFQRAAWSYPYARGRLIKFLEKLGKAAAHEARSSLLKALELRRDVIFLTHVPPFREVSVHKGKISNDDWMPWFSSAAMGDMLEEVAADHPNNRILVLAGHSHGESRSVRSKNLVALGGKADYGHRITAGEFTLPLQDELWES